MIFFHLRVSQLLSFATTLCSQESASLSLPDFPVDNLPSALTVLVSSKSHDICDISGITGEWNCENNVYFKMFDINKNYDCDVIVLKFYLYT